jgi:protein-tyrosine-phosphatase
MPAARQTVVFLCADNSVRSPMAEGLFRHHTGERIEVESAGLAPKPVHPLVSEVLGEVGVASTPRSSKRIGDILGKRRVRYAVILRHGHEPDAPRIYPFATRTVRWDIEDPVSTDADDAEALERFRRVRDDIDGHVHALIEELSLKRPTSVT